ncbi:MAG: hypothetical protein WCI34_08270 [Actinomycetes bacterium]
MPTAFHLIESVGPERDQLASLMQAEGVAVTVSAPADIPEVPACDAAVFLASEDPLAPSGVPSAGQVEAWADAAARAGARFVLYSTVLLYADGGETELMANDPELDAAPQLQALADAELELFGSSAEILLLRLGLILEPGGTASESLRVGLTARSLLNPEGEGRFVPLLDRATLAHALVSVAPSDLHGGWDLVASDAPLTELLHAAATLLKVPEPEVAPLESAIASAGTHNGLRWLVSRRVTGRDLRETGAVQPRDWNLILKEALA